MASDAQDAVADGQSAPLVQLASGPDWTKGASESTTDVLFVVILSVAALLRLYLATVTPFMYDEFEVHLPLAETISFSPDHLNLPLRGPAHPATAAYLINASVTLFGTSELGHRAVHLMAGLCMIVLVYLIARRWYGRTAALWAAALLGFNEYHIRVSSLATSHAPHLLFVTVVVFAFSRFLESGRARHLYGAATATAFAFYCKEHSALLAPVALLSLLRPDYRKWLKSAHTYLAGGLFLLLISPDVYWNLAKVDTGSRKTYADHLTRVGGIGLSPYPLVFFFGPEAARRIRSEFADFTHEYPTMNPGSGLVLLVAVCAAALGRRTAEGLRGFLLIMFGVVFGFFLLIRPGPTGVSLDPVSWGWVDMTLPATTILAGAFLSTGSSKWHLAARWLAGTAMLYAVVWNVAVYNPAQFRHDGQDTTNFHPPGWSDQDSAGN